MYKNGTALGLPNHVPHPFMGICDACELSKRNLQAITSSSIERIAPPYAFHSVCCDYVAMKPVSYLGDTGFFAYSCTLSKNIETAATKSKSSLLSTFKVLVKRQEGLKQPIRHFYTDSEKIFKTIVKGSFSRYLIRHGITAHFSAPYRHEQSLAERPIQTLKRASIATMLHSKLSPKYWPYVIEAVAHTWNRLPLKSTGYTKSPYELVHGRRPDVSYLLPIGMQAYVRRRLAAGELPDRSHRETLRPPNATVGRIIGYYPED